MANVELKKKRTTTGTAIAAPSDLSISFGDGTEATPSITGTDTDTGIWFPAANEIAVSTNGSQVFKFDSSGRCSFAGGSPGGSDPNSSDNIKLRVPAQVNNFTIPAIEVSYNNGGTKSGIGPGGWYIGEGGTTLGFNVYSHDISVGDYSSQVSVFEVKNNAKTVRIGESGGTAEHTVEGDLSITGVLAGNAVPGSEVWLETGNGFGSTNTRIRRFTNSVVNTGSDITYADSATLGATFTINQDGIYAIDAVDSNTAAAFKHGISVNSNQLTTDIGIITASHRLGFAHTSAANFFTQVSAVARLSSGDVVRAHSQTGTNGATSGVMFRITQLFKY